MSKDAKNKEMKIADSVLLSLFMGDNEKCNISHAPNTGFSGTQFSILNVLESLTLQDQKKYKNSEMKSYLFMKCM